jgi:pyruvate/2-oxoglutarate dehydrogenase complex dihydrolipoamide dehydrogenase (E3) component
MAADAFDVVILGGGNAAMGVTGPARAADLSVAMIEEWDLGGTCPNRVGLTEAKAKEGGRKVKVLATDMSGWFSARTYVETTAWAKIIVDEATDRILGAHFVGHSGEELINLFALAMEHGIPATALADKIYAYPSPPTSRICSRRRPVWPLPPAMLWKPIHWHTGRHHEQAEVS